MKKVCFIVSHLGSGSNHLVDILNKNPRCDIQNSSVTYKSPEDLNWLFSKPHKCRDRSAVYGDHILFNQSFSCKNIYEICKFIYIIRSARNSLNEISKNSSLKDEFAANYYRFRLRRICEMARKTPNLLFFTWEEIISGSSFQEIENYLGLKEKLTKLDFTSNLKDSFDEKLILDCEDAYERYYYYLKSLKTKGKF